MRSRMILFALLFPLFLTGCGTTSSAKRWSHAPKLMINEQKTYTAIVTTSLGSFTIHLFAKSTPLAVNNFVFLAKQHFYNGLIFFRIIRPFMIQTGDPNNNGTGGPGYTWPDELPPKYPYQPGIVAMANAGPNTNGSQFFICTGADSTALNQAPNYTEFGKVTSGMKVVDQIAAGSVTTNPITHEKSYPKNPIHILSIYIHVS